MAKFQDFIIKYRKIKVKRIKKQLRNKNVIHFSNLD